ncbi:uncharacterized protein [Patagioenas fasciata]|uniref:uncharacterized protein n=1 Tax=Patagioenas fasciata TaxID=372321 RepID=UPI003A98D564
MRSVSCLDFQRRGAEEGAGAAAHGGSPRYTGAHMPRTRRRAARVPWPRRAPAAPEPRRRPERGAGGLRAPRGGRRDRAVAGKAGLGRVLAGRGRGRERARPPRIAAKRGRGSSAPLPARRRLPAPALPGGRVRHRNKEQRAEPAGGASAAAALCARANSPAVPLRRDEPPRSFSCPVHSQGRAGRSGEHRGRSADSGRRDPSPPWGCRCVRDRTALLGVRSGQRGGLRSARQGEQRNSPLSLPGLCASLPCGTPVFPARQWPSPKHRCLRTRPLLGERGGTSPAARRTGTEPVAGAASGMEAGARPSGDLSAGDARSSLRVPDALQTALQPQL